MVHEDNNVTLQCTYKLGQRYKIDSNNKNEKSEKSYICLQ